MRQLHLLIYLMKVIAFMYAVKGHVGEECLCHYATLVVLI